MQTSESIKSIIPAFIKAQSQLKPISKDRENPFANSKYTTLDKILETILPILTENGLALTQKPITEQTETGMKVGIETTIFHSSGEFLKYEPFFMELEKGSKMNMSQSAGSVFTYAKRYAVSAIFGISTDEDTDGVQPTNPNNKNENKKDDAENEFYKNKAEFQKRLTAVANKTGKKYKELEDYVISESNKNLKKDYKNINSQNISKAIGYVKVLENAANKKAEANEQQSMMQGNTTNPVDWGK